MADALHSKILYKLYSLKLIRVVTPKEFAIRHP